MVDSHPRLAYLVSQYPAISHTFINREIQQLEAWGIGVHPFSMRHGQILPGATDFEKSQLADTYCIHGQSLLTKIGAQFLVGLQHPLGYLKGLLYALALQKGRLKETLWALFHFLEAAILYREMRRRGLTHIHVHFANSEAYIALYAHYAFGVGFSFTLHGPDAFYNTELGNLREKIRRAAFVICISNFARGQAMRLSQTRDFGKFHIVHCGVDSARYRPFPKPPPSADQPLQIVCTGRLTATKGQILLAMACAGLAEKGRLFHCKFIGDGDHAEALRLWIAERGLQDCIQLTGPLPQDGVLEALKSAHLFVLPSFAEGVPVVLMEAMSMGIPCISTRVGGIAELIENGRNGWLIHSGDPDTLLAVLDRLCEDPSVLAPMGEAARATIQDQFEVGKNAQRLAAIFQEHLKPGCTTRHLSPGPAPG